ncbi:unnamed protein product [Mesocestoides corti]|uniref:CRC domain-containing protein n=1 Tax=Mesocestoides corti TaxID=53468 RepID=A0A0R3UCZ2_MESCO|nr:unnamed protein product [Mesocestoides corti]
MSRNIRRQAQECDNEGEANYCNIRLLVKSRTLMRAVDPPSPPPHPTPTPTTGLIKFHKPRSVPAARGGKCIEARYRCACVRACACDTCARQGNRYTGTHEFGDKHMFARACVRVKRHLVVTHPPPRAPVCLIVSGIASGTQRTPKSITDPR